MNITFCVCIFRSKNIVFVPFAVRDFDSKVLVFLFLNTVNWFRQEINAYGDLLQNERHVLKHVSNLQNETTRFWSVFQVYKIKNTFLKRLSSLKNKKHVFEAFSSLQNKKKHVFEAFSSLQHENHFFEAFFTLKNEKARFWSVFKFTKWKNTFLKRFHICKMKKYVFKRFFYV